MCGRYYMGIEEGTLREVIDAVNRVLKVGDRIPYERVPVGEIAPGSVTPVLIQTPEGPARTLMRWGFPGYAKAGAKAKPRPIINARSETVQVRPSFAPYLGQRVLIEASRYFEYLEIVGEKKKQKYGFAPEYGEPFYMAALYREVPGEALAVFTILTMDASPAVMDIHDRMPVILKDKSARRAWMQGARDLKGLFAEAAERDVSYERL